MSPGRDELDASTGDPRREKVRVASVDDVVVRAVDDERGRGDRAVDARVRRARGGLRLPAGRVRWVLESSGVDLVDQLARRLGAEGVLDEAPQRVLRRQ